MTGEAASWILVFAVAKFTSNNPVSAYTFLTEMFEPQDINSYSLGADGFLFWILLGFPFYAWIFTLFVLLIESKRFHVFLFCVCIACVTLWPLDALCILQCPGLNSTSFPVYFNYCFMAGLGFSYILTCTIKALSFSSHVWPHSPLVFHAFED
jgi:hypothetical protein